MSIFPFSWLGRAFDPLDKEILLRGLQLRFVHALSFPDQFVTIAVPLKLKDVIRGIVRLFGCLVTSDHFGSTVVYKQTQNVYQEHNRDDSGN